MPQRVLTLVEDLTDQLERIKASIRAKVEHPFRVIKRQFGHVKVRYCGLKKNTAQLHTLFALSNLWMARGSLMGSAGMSAPEMGQEAGNRSESRSKTGFQRHGAANRRDRVASAHLEVVEADCP